MDFIADDEVGTILAGRLGAMEACIAVLMAHTGFNAEARMTAGEGSDVEAVEAAEATFKRILEQVGQLGQSNEGRYRI